MEGEGSGVWDAQLAQHIAEGLCCGLAGEGLVLHVRDAAKALKSGKEEAYILERTCPEGLVMET